MDIYNCYVLFSPPVIRSYTTVLCFVSVLFCGAALAATRSLRASIQLPLVGSIKFILSLLLICVSRNRIIYIYMYVFEHSSTIKIGVEQVNQPRQTLG